METPLLQTKLYIPSPRPELVPRPRLIERLNDGLHRKLTLVSAPAGYGKTTLINGWLEQLDSPIAWVSLDDGDNDPTRFLVYLLAALQMVDAQVGKTAVTMLQSPQPPPSTVVVSALINDVVGLSNHCVLVLDDYHVITETAVHQAVTFLLDNLLPNLHLVITSRAIPPLPLPRLRARGQLTEIDQQALRFTTSETAALLNDTLLLNLTSTQIAALESRTEGWIAGLHIAALSMQNRADVAEFIDTFSGGHRYIFDYLVDEVLAQQPETIREFLQKTAVLNHLRADLCDALLGVEDWRLEATQSPISNRQSQSILEQLDAAHLFITPLDDRREWYRYHPLFADVLRQQLAADERKVQHRRASRWFAEQGMLPEAIHHALAAHAMDDAAQLIQQAAYPTLMRGEHQTLQRWLNALPSETVRSQSKLALYQGWLYFIGGQIEDAAMFAAAASNNLPADAPSVQQGRLDCLRAWIALHQDSAETAVSLAQSAVQNLGDADKQFRMLAGVVLGEAYDMMGDAQAAVSAYRDGVSNVAGAEDTVVSQVALLRLAVGLNDTGRRREAVALVQQHSQKDSNSLLQLAAAALALEANQLETAVSRLQAGLTAARQLNIGGGMLYGQHILAQVQLAQGDWEAALQTARQVSEMGREQQSSFYINWAAAFLARIQMQYGEETAVTISRNKDFLDEAHLTIEKQPLLWEEPVYFFAARQLLAQHRPDEALRLLTQLETSVQRGGRDRMRLTIILRQALAYQMKNDRAKAAALLQKALKLAAPEGYLVAFLDEGEALIRLLKQTLPGLSGTAVLQFAGQVLAAGGEEQTTQTLIEPLTERELDILRLVVAGRSNAEIGELLFLSLNTVKWHLKNIYAKLDVRNRIEATNRASELDLL